MIFEIVTARMILACLALSLFVTGAFVIRIGYRHDIRYDVASEWFGHLVHGIGMTYMSLVMLGWVPIVVPFTLCAAFFVACSGVFVWRLIRRTYYIWWWDLTHVFAAFAMAYMFVDTRYWSSWATVAFIAYFVWVIWVYMPYIKAHLQLEARPRFAGLLSDGGHIAMAIVMILMFSVMQWPGAIGVNMLCIGNSASVHQGHKH